MVMNLGKTFGGVLFVVHVFLSPSEAIGAVINIKSIQRGHEFGCAQTTDDTVWCWGRNDQGWLGVGDHFNRSTPVEIPELRGQGIMELGKAGRNAYAITRSNHLWIWGPNLVGQTGNGNLLNQPLAPVDIGLFETVGIRKLRAFYGIHYIGQAPNSTSATEFEEPGFCAILLGDSVWCWGNQSFGRYSRPYIGVDYVSAEPFSRTIPLGLVPQDILPWYGADFPTEYKNSPNQLCVLSHLGQVYCAVFDLETYNTFTQKLPEPDIDLHRPGFPIKPATQFFTIETSTLCVLYQDSDVYCLPNSRVLATRDPELAKLGLKKVEFNSAVAFGFAGNGDVYSWGHGPHGHGIGTVPRPRRLGILSGRGVTTVAITTLTEFNTGHACAVLGNGQAMCWGQNGSGVLGLGESINRFRPVSLKLGPGEKLVSLSVEKGGTCGLLANGLSRCWGASVYGENGIGSLGTIGAAPGETFDTMPFLDF